MAKPRPHLVSVPIKPVAPAPAKIAALGTSHIYQVEKYGLYRYQLYCVDLESGDRTKVGEENVYNVVASNLIDLIFNDINPGNLK